MKKILFSLVLLISISQHVHLMGFFGGPTSEKVQALMQPLESLSISNVAAFRINNSPEYKDMVKVVADSVELLEMTNIQGKGKKISISGPKKNVPKGMIDIYLCFAHVKNFAVTDAQGTLAGKVTIVMNDDKYESKEKEFGDIAINLINSRCDLGGIQAKRIKISAKKKSNLTAQKMEGELDVLLDNSIVRIDQFAGKVLTQSLTGASKLKIAGKVNKLDLKRIKKGSLFDGLDLSVANAMSMNLYEGSTAKVGDISAKEINGNVKGGSVVYWRSFSGTSKVKVSKGSFVGNFESVQDQGYWEDHSSEERGRSY